MEIVINTNSSVASAKTLINQIGPMFEQKNHFVVYNDWKHYNDYDLILFVAPDSDVVNAKRFNPEALVGIIDPKIIREKMDDVKQADFLVPTSFEQKDIFLKYRASGSSPVIHHLLIKGKR